MPYTACQRKALDTHALVAQGSAKTKGSHKALLLDDTAPTWQELEGMLAQREAELQCAPADLETGPASSHALKRTFGSSEAPRVKLYRDSAAWCPYCQKVRRGHAFLAL